MERKGLGQILTILDNNEADQKKDMWRGQTFEVESGLKLSWQRHTSGKETMMRATRHDGQTVLRKH